MSDTVKMNDIPSYELIRDAFIVSLKSGRAKNADTVAKDVATALGLTPEQRNYRLSGSSTALFQNRFDRVRSSLVKEGLIEIPKKGKVKLTDEGKELLKSISIPGNASKKEPSSDVDDESLDDVQQGEKFAFTPFEPFEKEQAQEAYFAPPDGAEDDSGSEVTDSSFSRAMAESNAIQRAKAADEKVYASSAGRASAPPSRIKQIAASVIGFVLAFGLGNVAGTSGLDSRVAAEAAVLAEQQIAETEAEKVQNSDLTFVVNAGSLSKDVNFVHVRMTGETDSGDKVNEVIKVEPGAIYTVDKGAGEYLFQVETVEGSKENRVYQSPAVKAAYPGDHDLSIDLDLGLDEEATEALEAKAKAEAEAKAKKEAEAKAKAEAEAKVREEAEARERAEAEQRRQEEEAAAAAAAATAAETRAIESGQTNEHTVYITETGSKHHAAGCRYLNHSKIAISYEDAVARGYEACKVCGGG